MMILSICYSSKAMLVEITVIEKKQTSLFQTHNKQKSRICVRYQLNWFENFCDVRTKFVTFRVF